MDSQSFVDLVRNGKVKQPTQFGFSLSKWKRTYENSSEKSTIDTQLYESGVYFNDFLSAIRNLQSNYNDQVIDAVKLRKAYVAIVNRDYFLGTSAIKENIMSSKKNTIGSLIHSEIPIGPEGINVNPLKVIEGCLGALKYPLSDTFRDLSTISDKTIDELNFLDVLRIKINLASLYNAVSNFWGECLWNNWRIQHEDAYDIIIPEKSERHICRAISEYRWDSILAQMGINSFKILKKLSHEEKRSLLPSKNIQKIIKQGKVKKFQLGESINTEDAMLGLAMSIAGEEIYWDDLLKIPLPKYPNLKVRDLIMAWDILYSFGRIVIKNYNLEIDVKKINTLIQYAPQFKYSELESAIIKATNFPKEKVLSILEFWTYRGGLKEDLWVKPIIPLSNNFFCPLIPSILTTNRIRLIESWMKEGGLDLDARGFLFENYIRSEIKRSLKDSKLLHDTYIHGGPFKLSDGEIEEEIDLILIFDSLIIVGEIKCALFPTEPIEIYRFFRKINDGVEQAIRKANFIKQNLRSFWEKVDQKAFNQINKIEITPLVITNLPYGSGTEVNGVPVTDIRILSIYLGQIQKLLSPKAQPGNPKYQEITLYNSKKEAEENIIPFLKAPTNVKLYKKLLDKKVTPYPRIEDMNKNFAWLKIFVNEELSTPDLLESIN